MARAHEPAECVNGVLRMKSLEAVAGVRPSPRPYARTPPGTIAVRPQAVHGTSRQWRAKGPPDFAASYLRRAVDEDEGIGSSRRRWRRGTKEAAVAQ